MVDRNFNPFPILTTERLTLKQLSTHDQQNIFALRADPEINKYLDRKPANTIEDAVNFIQSVNQNVKNNNSIYWVIYLTKINTFVGTICLYDFSDEDNTCEIGFELTIKFQGQGIMKEATEEVIKYAFLILKCQKIIAFAHIENQKSTTLLTKLDFLQSHEVNKENFSIYIFTLSRLNQHP
jgi:[ribosomal protein S5]-alanine N-acetyltransferase